MDLKSKINAITNHKDNVIRLGKKLVDKLADDQNNEIVLRCFLKNLYSHDNSKFEGIEWEALLDKNDPFFWKAVQAHRVRQPHHPEYYEYGIIQMPDIYLMEMCVDWVARATEQAKDINHWLDNIACNRFKINKDSELYKKIKNWIALIVEEAF